MRSILVLSILALAGCGGSSASPTPQAQTWTPPKSYTAAAAAAVNPIPGPPVGPWACWDVQVNGSDPAVKFSQHTLSGGLTVPQSGIHALVPAKSTMWIDCVVPAGYVFVEWDHVGTVGTFYVEGTRCTFTAPSEDYQDQPDSNTVITAVVAPTGNG